MATCRPRRCACMLAGKHCQQWTVNKKSKSSDKIKITIIIINKLQAAERQVIHCYFVVSLGCLVALRVSSCVLVRACWPIYTFSLVYFSLIHIYTYICIYTCSSSSCRSQINTSESESTIICNCCGLCTRGRALRDATTMKRMRSRRGHTTSLGIDAFTDVLVRLRFDCMQFRMLNVHNKSQPIVFIAAYY